VDRSRRFVFVVGIAALVVGVGACGGGSSGPPQARRTTTRSAFQLVATSADAASAAKSARMSMSMDISAAGRSGSFTADGAFDFASRAGVLTMDVSSLGIPGGQGTIEVRVVDGVVYMDMSGLLGAAGPAAAQQLGGKHWFRLDISGLAGQSGAGGLGSLGSSDPTSSLDALRGVSKDVKEVGSDTVRGVDTTHYATTIDLTKALEQVPADQRAAAAKGLKTLGTGSVPADVWIDAQGRPRKLVMHLDGVAPSGGTLGTLAIELYDYGTKVDVHAPPADDTVDMMSLLRGALSGNGPTGGSAGSA
jgi:hypothetical protein